MDLDDFMAAHADLAWEWGTADCSLVLADWAMANGHPDPAVSLRGAYTDELGWQRIVVARGGLFPLVSDICARAHLPPANVPGRGVIAVIGAPHSALRQWGAIHNGERWLVRNADGFVPMTARALGMWVV